MSKESNGRFRALTREQVLDVADASPLDPRFTLGVAVRERQVVLHGGAQGIGVALDPETAKDYAHEILRAVAHIAALCIFLLVTSCSPGVSSIEGDSPAEAAESLDAARTERLALGNRSRVASVLLPPREPEPMVCVPRADLVRLELVAVECLAEVELCRP